MYNGNHNLLSPSDSLELTAEQVAEFVKCARDPIYFIENYYKIVHVDHGLIQFNPYQYQKNIITTGIENRYLICKLPRQCGKTTVIAAMILWMVLFTENYSVAILAHKQDQATEILDRIKVAYEYTPLFLQQGIIEWNAKSIELKNGSKIRASATSPSAIRGGSYNLVYLDEFAFVPPNMQEEFISSVFPTISSGKTTKLMITSTPKGMNMFYKLWTDAEEKRNDFKFIDIHWSETPGRDEQWKKEQIALTSEMQFEQEYCCEFLGSTNTLISGNVLKQLTSRTPELTTEYIRLFEKPKPDSTYLLTVDTARGLGLDYSAFIVLDITEMPYKVCLTYRNNRIEPYIFPDFVKQFAEHYNNALVLIETNDMGQSVADILYKDLEYENVLATMPIKNSITISGGFSKNSQLGCRTTKLTKRTGCASLKSIVENNKIVLNDFNIIYELMRFVSNNKDSYAAEEGTNDDLVMCLVIAAWAVAQPYMKDLLNKDIRQTFLADNEKMIEDSLTPFGIIYDHSIEAHDDVFNDLPPIW